MLWHRKAHMWKGTCGSICFSDKDTHTSAATGLRRCLVRDLTLAPKDQLDIRNNMFIGILRSHCKNSVALTERGIRNDSKIISIWQGLGQTNSN